MIKTTTGLFSDHNHSSSSGDGSTPHRLLLIVSDGGIRNSAEWTRPAVKYARERGIFIVCIIVDNPEVMEMRSVIVIVLLRHNVFLSNEYLHTWLSAVMSELLSNLSIKLAIFIAIYISLKLLRSSQKS